MDNARRPDVVQDDNGASSQPVCGWAGLRRLVVVTAVVAGLLAGALPASSAGVPYNRRRTPNQDIPTHRSLDIEATRATAAGERPPALATDDRQASRMTQPRLRMSRKRKWPHRQPRRRRRRTATQSPPPTTSSNSTATHSRPPDGGRRPGIGTPGGISPLAGRRRSAAGLTRQPSVEATASPPQRIPSCRSQAAPSDRGRIAIRPTDRDPGARPKESAEANPEGERPASRSRCTTSGRGALLGDGGDDRAFPGTSPQPAKRGARECPAAPPAAPSAGAAGAARLSPAAPRTAARTASTARSGSGCA